MQEKLVCKFIIRKGQAVIELGFIISLVIIGVILVLILFKTEIIGLYELIRDTVAKSV